MTTADTNPNGLKAIAMVRRFLVEMGFSPMEERLEDRVVFQVAFEGPADQGIAQVVENGERFIFHFVFPGYVPVARRPNVAEFIARANWRLIEGCFQLDFDTGALRYKVGIDFSQTELTEPLVRNAVLSGMNAIELFIPALMAVIEAQLEPAEAYESISLTPARFS